jgi:lipopolysaccharide export system protein LptA
VARKGENGATQQIVADSVGLVLAADGSSRMILKKDATVTMITEQGRDGRRIAANSLELDVATDGSLTRAVGRESVRLDLPAAAGAPPRSIRANSMDGTGEAGKGLTSADFAGEVVFTEGAPSKAATARTARANRLQAFLTDDAITSATFTVDVAFEEAGLKGCAARVEYQPAKGSLALSGATAEGNPIVVEEQIAIEAPVITVALDSRRMVAKDGVSTRVRTPTRCRPSAARPAAEQGPNRLPGLLKADAAATITASTLDYEGDGGRAVYSGRALLAQDDTTIRADSLTLDQKVGDLTATGNAVSTMILDGEVSTGRAHEIRYTDAKRVIRYAAPPPGTVFPPADAGRGSALAREPQLSGPQGNLDAAGRIEIRLAESGSASQQIDAYSNVRLLIGDRRATGGATLTYHAAEEKYVMTAGSAAPLVLVSACRESRGKTLIFYKANDKLEIDGKEERRTGTERAGGACTPTAAPPQARPAGTP